MRIQAHGNGKTIILDLLYGYSTSFWFLSHVLKALSYQRRSGGDASVRVPLMRRDWLRRKLIELNAQAAANDIAPSAASSLGVVSISVNNGTIVNTSRKIVKLLTGFPVMFRISIA